MSVAKTNAAVKFLKTLEKIFISEQVSIRDKTFGQLEDSVRKLLRELFRQRGKLASAGKFTDKNFVTENFRLVKLTPLLSIKLLSTETLRIESK